MERPKEHTFAGDDDRQTHWAGPPPSGDPYAPPREHAQPGDRFAPPAAIPPPAFPGYQPPSGPPGSAHTPPPGVAPPGYMPGYAPDFAPTANPLPATAPAVRGYGTLPQQSWVPDGVSYAPAPASVPAPPAEHDRRSGSGRGAAGWAAGSAMAALLAKFGILLKLLLPLGSAIISFGAYALLFGWQFAAGILLLLFIHEMGHYVVIRAKGLPAGLPVFIPLLGAYVAMRKMPHNVRDEAEIAIAGPLAGALAGVACVALYEQTGLRLLLVLAYFNFFINLINLIPVSPLDGGRIVGAISRWFWPLGMIALVLGFLYTQSLVLLILAWLGLGQTISRFRSARYADYYHMSWLSRVYITLAYFGLAAGLALAMFATENALVASGPLFR